MISNRQLLPLIAMIGTFAASTIMVSCTSTVTLTTPLGISVDMNETARMDTISTNEISIKDDLGQEVRILRFQRSQLTDKEIGQAILDSAKAKGIDLKTAAPVKVLGAGLIGGFVVGDSRLFSGFVAKDATDGYFMDINFKDASQSDAMDIAGSVKSQKKK